MADKKNYNKGQQQSTFFRKVNIFLKRINRQEVLTFLVFVLISTFFWVIKSASEETDATVSMELEIKNIPSDIVFTSPLPKQINLSIKDKNINLLSYSLDTLTVDFSSYHDALGSFRVSGAELQAMLLNKLAPSTQITAIAPSIIEARFAKTDGKVVPVEFISEISTASNYRCHQPVLFPDSVVVHAPADLLDTINVIRTELYKVNSLKDSVTVTVPLNVAVGVKSTPSSIKVLIPVANYVEKTISNVKINVVDVPENESVSIFPNKTDISCLVDASFFPDVTEQDFNLTVSYKDIKSSKQTKLPVNLVSTDKINIVSNIKLHTTEVEYIIDEK